MKDLFSNIRFYVLLISLCWGIAVFIYLDGAVHSEQLLIIRLTQWYALTAVQLHQQAENPDKDDKVRLSEIEF